MSNVHGREVGQAIGTHSQGMWRGTFSCSWFFMSRLDIFPGDAQAKHTSLASVQEGWLQLMACVGQEARLEELMVPCMGALNAQELRLGQAQGPEGACP